MTSLFRVFLRGELGSGILINSTLLARRTSFISNYKQQGSINTVKLILRIKERGIITICRHHVKFYICYSKMLLIPAFVEFFKFLRYFYFQRKSHNKFLSSRE